MTYGSRETTRPVLSATRGRRGRHGGDVVWVLLFGSLLAALGVVFAWI